MTRDNYKTQSYQQLQKLVKDIHQWAEDNLSVKSPERADEVNRNLMSLVIAVQQHPEQAKTVLYCANAVWHMLFEDARRGARQRNIQGLPLAHELATKDVLISSIDRCYEDHPGRSITWLRERVANKTGYSGARSVARKTDWYNLKR